MCRNGQQFGEYEGLKRSNEVRLVIQDPTTPLTENSFNVPSLYQSDLKFLQILSTITDTINIELRAGENKQVIQCRLESFRCQYSLTVSRAKKALIQNPKSIRLCRGFEYNSGCPEEETWTSVVQTISEKRLKSLSCQLVVPWLSSFQSCCVWFMQNNK